MNGETSIPIIRPGQDCVYLLRLRGVIVYVGISNSFYNRIGAHLSRKDMEFDSVSFKLVGSRSAAMKIEDMLIRGLQPIHNACSRTKRGVAKWREWRNSTIGKEMMTRAYANRRPRKSKKLPT